MAQETQYCSFRYILGTVYSAKTEASEISPTENSHHQYFCPHISTGSRHIRIAADSTMLRMVKRLMALSLGVHREQLEHRIGLTWPRPFLLRPLESQSQHVALLARVSGRDGATNLFFRFLTMIAILNSPGVEKIQGVGSSLFNPSLKAASRSGRRRFLNFWRGRAVSAENPSHVRQASPNFFCICPTPPAAPAPRQPPTSEDCLGRQ